MSDLIIALREEIGNPGLFTGRKAELAALLKWAERTKEQYSKSKGILARRKKGKTALVQRFFNILYTNNDPCVVPFFFRVKEDRRYVPDFAVLFYRTFMSQFLGFQLRDPNLVNDVLSLTKVWATSFSRRFSAKSTDRKLKPWSRRPSPRISKSP